MKTYKIDCAREDTTRILEFFPSITYAHLSERSTIIVDTTLDVFTLLKGIDCLVEEV